MIYKAIQACSFQWKTNYQVFADTETVIFANTWLHLLFEIRISELISSI